MFQDTRPAPLGELGDDRHEFRVGTSREIAAVLRRLLELGTALNLSAPNGANLRTTLWTVDMVRERIGFSANVHDPHLQDLLDAGEAVAVAYVDNVKLQFDVGEMMLVHGVSTAVLQAPLPLTMYRFQRRQSYRVRPPRGGAVIARLRHPAIPDMALTLRVLDISVGGCALFVPHDVPAMPAGVRVQGAQLELDGATRLDVTLEIHHVTSLGTHGGVRLGCSMHGLDAGAQRTLQRYVDQAQRRSRVLSVD